MQSSTVNVLQQKLIETVMISPDYAKELLRVNIKSNRNTNMTTVKRYASDMRTGVWEDNGETIKFDEHGNLIDGQHRLMAVIESGMTIPATIVWGIKSSAFRTIDSGRKRSVADTFKMDGESNSVLVASAISWLWRWQNKNPIPIIRYEFFTAQKAKELLEHNPWIRDSATFVSGYKDLLIGMCNTSIITLCHYLFWLADKEDSRSKADEFIAKLCKGNDLNEGHPVLRAREQMRTMKAQRAKRPDYDYLAIIILSWNSWIRGNTKLKHKIYWDEARGGAIHDPW